MANQASPTETTVVPAWEAESMRLTGLLPSAEADAAALWTAVVGEEPEVVSKKRGVEQKAEGPFGDKRLALVVRPERTDWTLSPPVADEPPSSFPVVGLFPDALQVIQGIADRWTALDLCPSYQRIAMGTVLLFPVEDRVAGYRAVQGFLPAVRLDPENSSDFSYQINRPRTIDLSGQSIRVNRLAKWSVAKFQQVLLVLLEAPRTAAGEALSACRLELDINTDSDFRGELTREQMKQLFRQFADLAIEISNEGDKP